MARLAATCTVRARTAVNATGGIGVQDGAMMTEATYVTTDGARMTVPVQAGQSLMRTAILNGVPGIVGECGGQAMCATCHVYIAAGQDVDLPPIGDDEEEMLESTAAPRTEASRLSCQLSGLNCDAIVVEIPETQY